MKFLFAVLVLIVALAFVIVIGGASRSSSIVVAATPPAAFKGTVTRIVKFNANSVAVSYSIKNTGGNPGTSNCSVYVQDPSGSFPGFFATLLPKTLNANHSSSGFTTVQVGVTGARYVTQGRIDCK